MKYTLTIETDKNLTHCWHCPLLAIDVWENHYCCAGAEIIKYGTVVPVPGDCPLEVKDENSVFKDGLTSDIFRCGDCGKCVAKLDEYCWFCGQKLDWEE